MTEDLLKNIDADKENWISLKEIQDAIKTKVFDNEENLKSISEYITNPENTNELVVSMEKSVNSAIDSILWKQELTSEDMNILNLWNKLYWDNNVEKKQQLQVFLKNKVSEISVSVNRIIWQNNVSESRWYTHDQIKTIQLRANFNFGENLQLTGERWTVWVSWFWDWKNSDNERITNLYIYRQELITRKWVIDYRKSKRNLKNFEYLLKVPNLNNLLWTLDDKDQENMVLEEFLTFFLDVRRAWFHFENDIWKQLWFALKNVLTYLVLEAKYKDVPLNTNDINEEQTIPQNITTKWWYYRWKVDWLKSQILEFNNQNIDYNRQLIEQEKQKHDVSLYKDIISSLSDKNKWQDWSKVSQYKKLLDDTNSFFDSETKKLARKEIFLTMISDFNAWEIKTYFWEETAKEFNSIIQASIDAAAKWDTEEITDMLSQIDNIRPLYVPMIDAFSANEINNFTKIQWQWWFTDAIFMDAMNQYTLYSLSSFGEKKPHVEYVHKMLNIPWIADSVCVSFDKKDQKAIEDAMIQANKWLIKLVMPWFQIWKNKLPDWIFGANASTLISLNDFSIVKELDNWDIQLYKIWEKEPFKTIKKEEQVHARMVESDAMRATAWSKEFQKDLENLRWLSWCMQKIQKLADKMNAEHYKDRLTDEDEEQIFKDSKDLAKELNILRNEERKNNSISRLRDELIRLKNSRDAKSLKTDQEKQLDSYIQQLTLLSNWLKPNSDVDKFISYMTNAKNIHANDTFWKEAKTWLKDNLITIVCAIGIAVALVLAVPSWWTSLLAAGGLTSLLTSAAVMTAGGMIWARVWQYLNEKLWDSETFWTFIEIDGKRVQIHYDDPTDVELLINGNMSAGEFLKGIWTEFLIGTAMTAGFMFAWKVIWSKISAYILQNPSSKMAIFLKKIPYSKLKELDDPYAKEIFSDTAQSSKSFWGKFIHEFWEELREESFETGAEQASDATNIPLLWLIVSTWHSLTPNKYPKIYGQNKVALDRFYPWPWKSIVLDLTYDKNLPDARTKLIEHFTELWFRENPDGSLSKQNDVNPNFVNVINLQESRVPADLRSLSWNFSNYWIYFDHETESEAYFTDEVEMNKFISKIESSGNWTIKKNVDGSYVFNTSDNSIIIRNWTDRIWNGFKFKVGWIVFDQSTWVVTYDRNKFNAIKVEVEEKGIWTIDVKENGIFELHLNTWEIITVYPSMFKISTVEVLENSRLDKQWRLNKAEELLWRKLTENEQNAILEAHNQTWEPLNLKLSEIRSRVQILKNAWFTIEERRILIETWICWKFALDESKIQSMGEELNARKKAAEENAANETDPDKKSKYEKEAKLWWDAIKKLNTDWSYLRDLGENTWDVTILEETYMKFRNDFKKLWDKNLLLLTKIYKETILNPLWIIVVDPYMTFEGKVDDSFASTENEFNGNELINESWSSNSERLSNTLKENDIMKKIRKKEILDNIWNDEANTIVQDYLSQLEWGEKAIASKLRESLSSKTFWDGRVLAIDKLIIFSNNLSYMSDYMAAYPDASPQKVYKLLDVNQNKLLHQTIQDKSYLTWSDHGILHILRGNLDMAENFFEDMTPLERVFVRQATIDHDLWYTASFNRSLSDAHSWTYFDATKDHPLYSADFVDGKMNWYGIYFWNVWWKPAAEILRDIIAGHSNSKPKTIDLPEKWRKLTSVPDWFDAKVVDAVVSVVDCAAASWDYKSAFFFAQPEIMVEFEQVFNAMEKQSWIPNIEQAILHLQNIAQIIEACPDAKMKEALYQASINMHLSLEGWEVLLKKEIETITNMSTEQVESKMDSVLGKILKKWRGEGKSLEDAYKAFNKFIKTYNKANKLKIAKLEFDVNTASEESIIQKYNEIVGKGGSLNVEAFKNYLKYDKVDWIVSFPYKKYIAQYGVRLRTDPDTWRKMIWENDGIVVLSTELAWSTFEALAETIWPEMALESFFKVSEDFDIEDIKPSTSIKDFKSKLSKCVENWINWWKVWSLQDAILRDFEGYKNDKVKLTNKKSWLWRFELIWNKKEKVALYLEWKSYDMVNAVEQKREEILGIVDDKLSELDFAETLEDKIVVINDIKQSLTTYLDTFAVDWQTLANYLDDIFKDIETMDPWKISEYLNQKLMQITTWYQLSNFDIISN